MKSEFLLLFCFLIPAAHVSGQQQCNVPGKIVHSYLLYVHGSVLDANDCLTKCKEYVNGADPERSCKWWSIDYDSQNECSLWNSNLEVDTVSYPNSEHGQVECSTLECDKQGVCQGTLLKMATEIPSLTYCVNQCNFDADVKDTCSWVSYQPLDQYCLYFSTCMRYTNNTYTTTMTSAQKACRF